MTNIERDGPGTENYRPIMAERDAVFYATRSTRATPPNGNPGRMAQTFNLEPPDPTTGGEMGQFDQLGYSTGFGAFKRGTPFTGRVITARPLGAHPPVGPVGYSTRSQRLRQRVEALYTDYTPSDQQVAQEILTRGKVD